MPPPHTPHKSFFGSLTGLIVSKMTSGWLRLPPPLTAPPDSRPLATQQKEAHPTAELSPGPPVKAGVMSRLRAHELGG